MITLALTKVVMLVANNRIISKKKGERKGINWPHKLITIIEANKEKRDCKNHEFTNKLMI